MTDSPFLRPRARQNPVRVVERFARCAHGCRHRRLASEAPPSSQASDALNPIVSPTSTGASALFGNLVVCLISDVLGGTHRTDRHVWSRSVSAICCPDR